LRVERRLPLGAESRGAKFTRTRTLVRFMNVVLIHGKLRGGRWDALPSHLFERVGEFDEPRLAAGAASEADPKW
jgi:hypothetical protein